MTETTPTSPIDTTVLDYKAPTLDNAKRQEPQLEDMWGKLRISQWKNRGMLWHIILTDGTTSATAGDSYFSFTVPPQLDGGRILWVGLALTSTSASGGPILVNLAIGSNDLLTTRISVTDGDKYSWKTATTQPVIDQTYNILRSGDQIDVDVDDIGDGAAYGWQLYIAVQ